MLLSLENCALKSGKTVATDSKLPQMLNQIEMQELIKQLQEIEQNVTKLLEQNKAAVDALKSLKAKKGVTRSD